MTALVLGLLVALSATPVAVEPLPPQPADPSPSISALAAGSQTPGGVVATFVPVSPIARPRKRLFARLFNVDGRDSPDRLHEIRVGIREQRETRPRILCGMTVIEVTPDVDPTMVVPLPEDGPRFSARRIRPSICVR